MKKNICFLIIICFTIFSCSQKVAVPDVVKTKFVSLYPDAKNVKWDKEDGLFEAGFKTNDVETSVVFDAAGTVTETETAIEASSLPAAISEYVAKNLDGRKIEEAAKIVDAAGKVNYEAEVDKADYIFDETGNFLSKKEKDKEEDID
jgi:hypothetical protein